jgi:uncharacterized protein (DUF362 family)
MEKVIIKDFKSYQETVPAILKEADLAEVIKKQKQILLKPNLTTNLPPPVTTAAELTEEVIKFCQNNSPAKIVIAEGAGGCDTEKVFSDLGYTKLAQKYDVKLLDLNKVERIERQNPNALKLKKVFLPKIGFESFIINLPVLKVHLAAKMTAAMKNVYGFYLNQKWLKQEGLIWRAAKTFVKDWWNKSELHLFGVNETIIDLNNYIKFDFNLVDASIGQLGEEIHGKPCEPPIGKLIAGYDAKAVDIACAPFLGLDPKEIVYLR